MKDELITELVTHLRGSGVFILEQAPDVLSQILGFAMFKSILMITLMILPLYFLAKWDYVGKGPEETVFNLVVKVCGLIVASIPMLGSIIILFEALLFPKLFLLKYLLNLL